jgi:3-phosphoshikimate 1-carboxyvinyltransferase
MPMGTRVQGPLGLEINEQKVLVVAPSVLSGVLKLPPSKSHAMRWLTLASMDENPTKITMWEIGNDVQAMIDCWHKLGIKWSGDTMTGGNLSQPNAVLDCVNSGTALRFLIAQSATCNFPIVLDGDASLRTRSSLHLIESLGVPFSNEGNCSEYPLKIHGPFNKEIVEIDVSRTSQFYSAVMLMAPRTNGFTLLTKGDAVSRRHSALTWELCQLTGAKEPGITWDVNCPDINIPPDASMMAFAKLASLDVENPPEKFESIGHSLENSVLRDSNDLITPMAAWLSMSNGGVISGAAHAAHKESNRITRTVEMLSKFGIVSSATPDGIIVKGGQVPRRPEGVVATYGDHRIQMTAVILAGICGGEIEGSALHEVAWPSYIEQLQSCGLVIESK